ncbi:MAG: hypothetical protein ACU85U_07750 [Gammaproteobacteria bacterium]
MKLFVAEQPVDGLDVVFDVTVSGPMSAEMGEGQLPTAERRIDDAHDGIHAILMSENAIAFEPIFSTSEAGACCRLCIWC